MRDPFNQKWYPTFLNEHIAGLQCYALPIVHLKSLTEEESRIEPRDCHDIQQHLIPSAWDKLYISWKQGRWDCSLCVDKFNGQGRHWCPITRVAISTSDANYPEAHVALNCQYSRAWLWFYITENGHKVWWPCPSQITEIIVKHIRQGKKNRRAP